MKLNMPYILNKLPYFIILVLTAMGFNAVNGIPLLSNWLLILSFSIAAITFPTSCLIQEKQGLASILTKYASVAGMVIVYGYLLYSGTCSFKVGIPMMCLSILVILTILKAARTP